MIASTDARRSFVANLVVSGHYARQCLAIIAATEARATAKFARFGYEDVQKHLSCGLYEKNKRDMLKAYTSYQRDMAAALATHEEDLRSGGFPTNLTWFARRYRRMTSVIGKRYEKAIQKIDREYTKSVYRQQTHAFLHFARWLCHLQLFGVGAIVSGPTYAEFIGHHVKVYGSVYYLVPIGTYVHVENGKVYSNERFLAEFLTGSDAEDEDSVVMNGELGRYKIGEIDTDVELPNNTSAIIWGRYYADNAGRDEDEIDDDASYPDGFDRLFYNIVILGSSGVYHYNEWDQLYSPLKSCIVNRA